MYYMYVDVDKTIYWFLKLPWSINYILKFRKKQSITPSFTAFIISKLHNVHKPTKMQKPYNFGIHTGFG